MFIPNQPKISILGNKSLPNRIILRVGANLLLEWCSANGTSI